MGNSADKNTVNTTQDVRDISGISPDCLKAVAKRVMKRNTQVTIRNNVYSVTAKWISDNHSSLQHFIDKNDYYSLQLYTATNHQFVVPSDVAKVKSDK